MENNEQIVEQTEEKAIVEPAKTVEPAKAEDEKTRKYTDAEVDEIINKRFAKWQAQQEKKVEEAKRLEKMNAEEKAKYERDELQKQLDALKAEKAHNEMAKTAKAMITQQCRVQPSDGLVDALVRPTAEETAEAVKGFIAFNDEYFKSRISGGEPRKGSPSALTREEIMAIKDDKKRLKAIQENLL